MVDSTKIALLFGLIIIILGYLTLDTADKFIENDCKIEIPVTLISKEKLINGSLEYTISYKYNGVVYEKKTKHNPILHRVVIDPDNPDDFEEKFEYIRKKGVIGGILLIIAGFGTIIYGMIL